MGREIKRVALDFNWPLRQTWQGYLNPYYQHSKSCPFCEGSGYNSATKKLSDDWYDFARTGRRWSNDITQDEVDALVAKGRSVDLTSQWKPGEGWVATEHKPTAQEVNEWSRQGFGHDSLNHWVCLETRAKRLGVWGLCEHCHGDGTIWLTNGLKLLSERWQESEPPTGEGWQVWETVSEGSPVSPVFATSEGLVDWLVEQGYTREAASNFVAEQWAPSMVGIGGKLYSDIESCAVMPAQAPAR